MINADVPVSTSNIYEILEDLEELLIEVINFGWPLFNPIEWNDSWNQVKEVAKNNTISDAVQLT